MIWDRIKKPSQAFSAHTLLFCFTILLVLKLDHLVSYSWWIIFFPLFLFHAVVARGRFSLPGSFVSLGRHVPMFVAFELLLCVFLESPYVSLKIVFIPLLAFELTILVDNLRMCRAFLSGVHEISSDDAIWGTLRHFCVAISMGFFVAGTVFTLLKLSGDASSLNWWDLFICFGIAECFVFLVCTKWSNAVIHRNSLIPEVISENRMCGLGGHVMKILIIIFQILLCMRLEGKPAAARFIPLPVVFFPIFLVQGLGVLFAASNLIKKIGILLRTEPGTRIYLTYAARARDSFGLQRGSRLFVWRSTDVGSRDDQAQMNHNGSSGYNTFSGDPPETVKRSPKKDLTEEVQRLRAALNEQKEITKSSQQNYERLQNDKTKCRICFDREINTVLLPCRHNILCSVCSEKCENCPVCRVIVKKRLPVYGV